MSLATEIAGNRKHVRLLDEDARSLTDVAVCELCQIPGHARYFADELERKWEIAKEDPWGVGKRCSYDFERRTYLVQTLPHLPSPETVMVLGSYLEDERDAPPAGYQPSDCNPIPQNSVLAAWGMSLLGIRGFPEERRVAGSRTFRDTENPKAARKWFAAVKSGEQAFSFKGQSVEYRFKPDGTWISTPIANPPDDAPAPPPAKSAQPAPTRPSDTPPPAATPVPAPRPVWPWIAGGIVAVLAATGYFLNSRRPPAG